MSNKKLFIIFIVFSLIVITIGFVKESFTHIGSFKEPFTPGLQKIYRPYIRSWRVYTEKMYKKLKDQSRVFFVRIGLL